MGGSASTADGGDSLGWWGDGTSRHDREQHAHVHKMWRRVRWHGKWWWREVSAPARSAQRAHELAQDSPMQPWIGHVGGAGGLTQHVQHACAQGGLVQAGTFDGSGRGACEAQGGMRGTGGAGLCKEGACAAWGVTGSPDAGRAPACTPCVGSGAAVSTTSSQVAATDETILRGGHGVCQAEERGESGFRRAVLGVSGVLRTTREAASATVQRAKRIFFRDTG